MLLIGQMPTPTLCRDCWPTGTEPPPHLRAKPRTRPRAGLLVSGVAHNFRTVTRARSVSNNPGQERELDHGGCYAHYLHPAAVDASLRLAAKRIGGISLLFDHDPRQELASTRDGSLVLWRDETALYFMLGMFTERGRDAARRIAARPDRRECSTGGSAQRRTMHASGNGPLWEIHSFDLEEISILRMGANPGTNVTVETL